MTNVDRDLVLVTGSSGWIGRRLSARLRERGCLVAGYDLVRVPGPWVETYEGDLEELAHATPRLRSLLQRTKTVIHCAGRAHRPVETPEEVRAFERANVFGTRNIINACLQNNIPRVVYVSTIAGYGWQPLTENRVAEDVRLRPTSAYARTKLEGEALISESPLDWRVVRLATVFGEGDRANFAKLARGLRQKRFVMPGEGIARKSVISIDLAADVLVEMALLPDPAHRLINAAFSDAPNLREICETFCEICHFPLPASVPIAIFRMLASVGTVINMVRPGFPLTLEVLRKLTTSTVVDNRRMLETLSVASLPTFREALVRYTEFYKNA